MENKIHKWIETKFDKGMAIAQEYKDNPSSAPQVQAQTGTQAQGGVGSQQAPTAASAAQIPYGQAPQQGTPYPYTKDPKVSDGTNNVNPTS